MIAVQAPIHAHCIPYSHPKLCRKGGYLIYYAKKVLPTIKPAPLVMQPAPVVVVEPASVPETLPQIVHDRAVSIWGAGYDYEMNFIISHESAWNPYAINPNGGACGLFQRLPCSVPIGDANTQINDGLLYIQQRYGNPGVAYQFWIAHGWY